MLNNIYKKLLLLISLLVLIAVAAFYYLQKNSAPVPAPVLSAADTKFVASAPLAAEKHVFIVVEENTSYSDIIGNNKDMPYLNQLANQYAYSKNYYADTHPSIGNYFMLTTGQIITNKDSFSGEVSEDNIVRNIIAAGKTWKEYSESIPTVGYTGGDSGNYSQHHNPLSYFSDVRQNPNQANNLVPISELKKDIENNQLPDYAFIVPNQIDDAHSCPSVLPCNKLASADQWLKANIAPLLDSPDFKNPGGGLLIITFDEAAGSELAHGGGKTAWVVVGSDIKKNYTSDTLYQHEDTLRFMSDALGLKSFPGKSASSSGMGEFLIGN